MGRHSGRRGTGSLIDQAIKRAADEQLAQKGLTKVDNNADLISVTSSCSTSKRASAYGNGRRAPTGDWAHGAAAVTCRARRLPFRRDTLMDVYDVGKKQLVWRGDAVKTIDLKKDPDKNYKNLQKVMAKLLKNYPPMRGGK